MLNQNTNKSNSNRDTPSPSPPLQANHHGAMKSAKVDEKERKRTTCSSNLIEINQQLLNQKTLREFSLNLDWPKKNSLRATAITTTTTTEGTNSDGPTKSELFPTTTTGESNFSPDVVENVRAIINTNGSQLIAHENELEKLGFTFGSKELARGRCTRFYRAQHGTQTLILKQIVTNKLAKRNFDLFFEQSVKIMRCLCCTASDESSASHHIKHDVGYFAKIYEIFYFRSSGIVYIFMELCYRSINSRIRRVRSVKASFVKRWIVQLCSAISFMKERAVAHRALRLENMLLDGNENIRITSWTRAVICLDPNNGRILYQPKEPKARRKNHLPSKVFHDSYDPSDVDFWSLGVCLAVLCTKHFPFNPCDTNNTFEHQWNCFVGTHQQMLPDNMLQILKLIFTFDTDGVTSWCIRQQEVRNILNESALDTETDELAQDHELLADVPDFVDVIENTRSLSSQCSYSSQKT